MSIDLNPHQTNSLFRLVEETRNTFLQRAEDTFTRHKAREDWDITPEKSDMLVCVGILNCALNADWLRELKEELQQAVDQWNDVTPFQNVGSFNACTNSATNIRKGSLSLGPITEFGAYLLRIIVQVHIKEASTYDHEMLGLLGELYQDQTET